MALATGPNGEEEEARCLHKVSCGKQTNILCNNALHHNIQNVLGLLPPLNYKGWNAVGVDIFFCNLEQLL